MASKKIFVIDFDSTLITVEAIEELARISLAERPEGEMILARITELTERAMAGKISFTEALQERVKLLDAKKDHLEKLIRVLSRKVTPSFRGNTTFFRKHRDEIYVISGGFREYVAPVVSKLGVREDHVFANNFRFASDGRIIGVNLSNPLAHNRGKIQILKKLNPRGEVYVIGDGFTDLEMKESGLVTRFISFTENAERPEVVAGADEVARSFDEVLHSQGIRGRFSYPRSKLRVLLLENVHPSALEYFRREGFQVSTEKGALPEEKLASRMKEFHVLGIRSKTEVSDRALRAAPKLLAIGAFCIGTNQIDLGSAARTGVPCFNAPYSNTRSVVELVLGNIIMLIRNIVPASNALHRGEWRKGAEGSREVRGKTIGIVGYGNIGSQLSVLAESLGMRVLFYDIHEKLALGNAQKCSTLRELLKVSDVVTLHVDGRPSNTHLIDEREFSQMKRASLFLNLSRGHVVNIKALRDALRSGHVRGAAVDVYPSEPSDNREPFISELQGMEQIILTPHIGGSTEEAQERIAEYVVGRLLEYVNNGGSFGSVNFPQIELPQLRGAHRLLHTHRNVPGILAQINGIMARGGINILGQYLKTTDDIGYVITDVDKRYNEAVIQELRSVENTIRFRVLY